MVNCCNCGASNITSFNFPANEPFRTQWKAFAGINKVTPGSSKLCIRHFSEDDLVPVCKSDEPNRKTRLRLRKNVIPSLNRKETCNFVAENKTSHTCLLCKARDNGIYFEFPKDIQRRNEWLRRCGYKEDYCNGDKFWYLCSRHFPEDVITKKQSANGRNRLSKDALPFPTLLIAAPQPFIPVVDKYRKIAIKETVSNVNSVDQTQSSVPVDSFCEIVIDDDSKDTVLNVNSVDETQSSVSADSCREIVTDNDSKDTVSKINSVDGHNLPSTIDELLATHSNCPTCAKFIQHFSSSTIRNKISSSPSTPSVSHTVEKRRIKYVGDITTEDLATPERAWRSFSIAKEEVLKCRRKIDLMQKKIHRLNGHVKKYKSLSDHLKNED